MYKIKIIFLYKCQNLNTWLEKFADWDGIEFVDDVIEEERKKEEETVKQTTDNILVNAFWAETYDITDGDYYCNDCKCHLGSNKNNKCMFCGSSNIKESS